MLHSQLQNSFWPLPTAGIQADSTAALQTAITAARTDNVTLFVPLGCYRVTDTLDAWGEKHIGRRRIIILMVFS